MDKKSYHLVASEDPPGLLNKHSVATCGEYNPAAPLVPKIIGAGYKLLRTTYAGKERPHNQGKSVTTTLAGVLEIAKGAEVRVVAQLKTGSDRQPALVLVANYEGERLIVATREVGDRKNKKKDHQKASISKLRRNKRGDDIFYVWTRDQYRFTIRALRA